MDLHSFHCVARELARLLDGARMEKIHAPQEDVHVFSLYARGFRSKLYLQNGRKVPLLFLSERKLENPLRPPARVMRLRKYFSGRRLGKARIHPLERCLAFPLAAGSDETGAEASGNVFLILDLVAGPSVAFALPESYDMPVAWPGPDITDPLGQNPMQRRDTAGPWQEYGVLTPLLRESLSFLDILEGRALMVDLEAGGGELFLYADQTGRAAFYSAWPLPLESLERRSLRPCSLDEALVFSGMGTAAGPKLERQGDKVAFLRENCPALLGASLVNERLFFAALQSGVEKRQALPVKKEQKRLARLAAKLDQEEQRLGAMFALREKALALQAILWRFDPEIKTDQVQLEDGVPLVLDPKYTVRENMTRMFHQSARGKRGLAMLAQRRQQLVEPGGGARQESAGPGGTQQGHPKTPGPAAAQKSREGKEYKDVARFTSSDGLIMLRGRNAKGNHNLLKIGKGHDLWLHVEEGPGAHVIIRRTHEGEEVPETTLMEAAALAAEKSFQGAAAGARIMVALLRHVRPVKGGGPGMVTVQTLQRTIELVLPDISGRHGSL